jgi:OPT family oligopeptide transporter
MLVGAIIGWGILSPLAKSKGWAPGPVDDWENGSKGWIVWVSLAIMLADSIISLGWLIIRPVLNYGPGLIRQIQQRQFWARLSRTSSGYMAIGQSGGEGLTHSGSDSPGDDVDVEEEDDAPPSELISTRTILILLPLTLILNVVCMRLSFGSLITPLLATLATILALFLSVMGVRAQGETDLNPVSGISKLTQLIFALVTPASSHTRRTAIVTNLLAGAVSESGALQAGDMMQDLKTGHLLGASPKAQFYGQVIGSLVGAVISAAVYKLYVRVYEVPGPMFQIPTAYVWIFTARLVTGQGLPKMAWQAAGIASVVFSIATILRIFGGSSGLKGARPTSAPWRAWIPGGIAVAVGMYNVPSFTLARAIGGVIVLWWNWTQKNQRKMNERKRMSAPDYDLTQATSSGRNRDEECRKSRDKSDSTIIILASGLILGEGVVSIINLALASASVPHL